MQVMERILKAINGIALGLMAFLTHQTILVCYMEGMSPPRSCAYGSAQLQLSALFIIALFTLLAVRLKQEGRRYALAWRRNWLVGAFVLLSVFSLFWTVYLPATIYRSFILVTVTLIAAYAGLQYSNRGLVIFVAVVVGIAAVASLLLAATLPNAAIMPNDPYTGLWRGIFWHKIYLGTTMALGCIAYMVILFSPVSQYSRLQKLLAAVMLATATVLAILSDSATGLITLSAVTGVFILFYLWLKWGHFIPRWGYWVISGSMLLGAVLLVTNLTFVFGLFNRSITLTGRTPLWEYLLETYVAQRPLFGHGFGAFWLQPGINEVVGDHVGWTYAVKVSDNGYLDILLELGLVGIVLLLFILVSAFARVVPQALRGKDLTSIYPVLLLIHIVLINISLSYFVQMESFMWFLLVMVLFMYAKPEREAIPASGPTS